MFEEIKELLVEEMSIDEDEIKLDAEFIEKLLALPNVYGKHSLAYRKGCKKTCNLTNVPFHGVQTVTTVCKVRCSDILARGQNIFHSLGYHSAKRNCKSVCGLVEKAVCLTCNVKVNRIASNTNTVGEAALLRVTNVIFNHREFCFDTARLSDIGCH